MNVFKLILYQLPLVVVTGAAYASLPNMGSSCYMNAALQALASIPKVSNLILSLDSASRKLTPGNQELLLKLQTIMYALRNPQMKLSWQYLIGFLNGIAPKLNPVNQAQPQSWDTKTRQDEAEFYVKLIRAIGEHLIPEQKDKDAFKDMLGIDLVVHNPTTGVDPQTVPLIVITALDPTVNSIENGLRMYAEARPGVPQHLITSLPPIFSIYVNRFDADRKKNPKMVTIPTNLDIRQYMDPALGVLLMPPPMNYDLLWCTQGRLPILDTTMDTYVITAHSPN